MIFLTKLFKVIIILILLPFQVNAALIVNNTRVIYNEKDGESLIKLDNKNEAGNPILVQVWMDNGDVDADPSELSIPFNVNPSIFKIDGQKSQSLHVIKTNAIIDNDKETLYWINFLEIPKKKVTKNNENLMQISVKSRLKFFYRPKNLSMSVYDAYKLVSLNITNTKPNYKIEIDNPTPYYMTFSKVQLESSDSKTIYASLDKKSDLMLAPFSKKNIVLKNGKNASEPIKINYSLVNDFGSDSKYIK